MTNFRKIWVARKQILEGVTNLLFKKEFVENVASYRLEICKSCEYYNGECYVPKTGPCCGACGCSLKLKLRSMSSACGLLDIDKEPLWYPIMTQKQDDEHFSELEDD